MTNDIAVFDADDIEAHARALGVLLHACVHDGASIGFVLPFSQAEGTAFWMKSVLPALRQGRRLLLVVRKDGRIVGTGQLDYDTPPNQPHRAEIRKVMVHPDFRRQGVAKALMVELESAAHRLGRGLITLDTRTGDKAEPLYLALGYQIAGVIPDYCRDPFKDQLDATTIMYKAI